MVTSIHCDWLTLNMRGQVKEQLFFKFKQYECGTRQFSKLYDVTYMGQLIGQVYTEPYLKMLPKDFIQFKAENRLFYVANGYKLLKEAFTALDWVIKDISRIDICCDFHTFVNGLNPENLIKGIAENKYYPMSRTLLNFYAEKDRRVTYQYLRMGAGKSAVRTILYNKTKELHDVKGKPWIQDAWLHNGLDPNREVWRLEFSCRHDALAYADKEDGSVVKFDFDLIGDNNRIREAYKLLYNRYFKIIRATSNRNHSREPKMDLLDVGQMTSVRIADRKGHDVNRADKQFIAKLHKELNLGLIPAYVDKDQLQLWVDSWVSIHHLRDYVRHRGLELEYTPTPK